jgi:hypothetical protein
LTMNIPHQSLASANKGESTVPTTSYLAHNIHVAINSDLSYEMIREYTVNIRSPSDVAALARVTIAGDPASKQQRILEAYTAKPDGSKIPARVPSSKVDDGKRAPGATNVAPGTNVQVLFDGVSVGDTLHYKVIVDVKPIPPFAKQFHFLERLPTDALVRTANISISAPAGLILNIDKYGFDGGKKPNTGARQQWEWKLADFKPSSLVIGSDKQQHYLPFVAASTETDYRKFALNFDSILRDTAETDQGEIAPLAENIAMGTTDKVAQARKLYDWVRGSIRYKPSDLGTDGYAPHDVALILKERQGDCKDHVILLRALLLARGIESTPVMIDTRQNYLLPRIPVFQAFNHLILFIPSMDLYVDPTALDAPFGVLPFEDTDKPVIHTAKFDKTRRTPPVGGENVISYTDSIEIQVNGTAKGRYSISSGGQAGMTMKSFIRRQPLGQTTESLRKELGTRGIAVKTVRFLENKERSENTLSIDYETRLRLSDESAITLRRFPLPYPLSLDKVASVSGAVPPTAPFPCVSVVMSETQQVRLASGVAIANMPADSAIRSGDFDYQSSYRSTGQDIQTSKRFSAIRQGNLCFSSDADAHLKVAKVVSEDLLKNLQLRLDSQKAGSSW